MSECPLCHATEGFRVKLVGDEARSTCRACQAVIPASTQHIGTVLAEPAYAAQSAPPPRATPATVADEPLDVIKAAKARLRFVDGELRRMRKLETERDQLRRLLSAASAGRKAKTPATIAELVRPPGGPRRIGTGN